MQSVAELSVTRRPLSLDLPVVSDLTLFAAAAAAAAAAHAAADSVSTPPPAAAPDCKKVEQPSSDSKRVLLSSYDVT